jgi:transposase-like protein
MKNHYGINRRTENLYFKKLFKLVHPGGLNCPHCGRQDHLRVHRRHKQSWITDFRCSHCAKKFNAWTGTRFQGTHHPPSELWYIIQGIIARTSTAQLSRELHCQRGPLDRLRHRLEPWVKQYFGPRCKETLATIQIADTSETESADDDGSFATIAEKTSAPKKYTVSEKPILG